jgi:hypothetical protein
MASTDAEEVDFVVLPGKPPRVILPKHLRNVHRKQNEILIFGHCMWPWLNPGDCLRVEPVASTEEIKVGWVGVFEWEGTVLSHRVIKVEGDSFWARGDISRVAQGPIHRSKLLGRVTAYCRNDSWNSIEGEMHRLGGLAYNNSMHFVVNSVERLPIIKSLWRQAWVGEKLGRHIGAVVGTALMGAVVVTQESRSDVIYGILQSDKRLLGNTPIDVVLRKNRVELFVARGRGEVQLGSAILYEVEPRQKSGLVRLAPINSFVMPIGVERELYRAIESAAQRKGIKRLLTSVDKDDLRAQEMASAAGYHQTTAKKADTRDRKALTMPDREHCFYEKLL